MDRNLLPDFRQYFEEWSQDLALLRQNRLLDEGAFIRFTGDRGLAVWGVVTGAPGVLYERGLLTSDGTDSNGKPLFHPFRLYPLHHTLKACQLDIAAAALHRDSVLGFVEQLLTSLPTVHQIEEFARERNRVVDLAILLEPVYWPRITGQQSFLVQAKATIKRY